MPENDQNKDKDKTDEKRRPLREEPPVETQHEVKVGGKTVRYSATAGMLPLKSELGETEAQIFFIALLRENSSGRIILGNLGIG